jgi:uncharacterized membrane protein
MLDTNNLNLPWLFPHERLILKAITPKFGKHNNQQARVAQVRYGLSGRVLLAIAAANVAIAATIGVIGMPITFKEAGQGSELVVLLIAVAFVDIGLLRIFQLRKYDTQHR